MSFPRDENAAWVAVLVALQASGAAAQTAWDGWRHAHEALMRELRDEPQLMHAWRNWLKAEAQAYESASANGGVS